MIRVRMTCADGMHRLEMTGHADYRPGNDIVCAGASALVCALAGFLQDAREHIDETPVQRVEPGDALLLCRGDAYITAAYTMAWIGLSQLAAAYPEAVTML